MDNIFIRIHQLWFALFLVSTGYNSQTVCRRMCVKMNNVSAVVTEPVAVTFPDCCDKPIQSTLVVNWLNYSSDTDCSKYSKLQQNNTQRIITLPQQANITNHYIVTLLQQMSAFRCDMTVEWCWLVWLEVYSTCQNSK